MQHYSVVQHYFVILKQTLFKTHNKPGLVRSNNANIYVKTIVFSTIKTRAKCFSDNFETP